MPTHECNKEFEIANINEKSDKIIEHIIEIKVESAKNTAILENQSEILKEHMKRTEIAESRLDKLEIPYKIIAFVGVPLGTIITLVSLLFKFNIM